MYMYLFPKECFHNCLPLNNGVYTFLSKPADFPHLLIPPYTFNYRISMKTEDRGHGVCDDDVRSLVQLGGVRKLGQAEVRHPK